jgi:hypothetical protein
VVVLLVLLTRWCKGGAGVKWGFWFFGTKGPWDWFVLGACPVHVSACCEAAGCIPPASVNAECAGSLSCASGVMVGGVAGPSYIERCASSLTYEVIPYYYV